MQQSNSSAEHARDAGLPPSFLPDFCRGEAILVVVLCAEAFALVLSLVSVAPMADAPAAMPGSTAFFVALGRYSLYFQWVTLPCAGLLCLLRAPLRRLGNVATGVLAYLLILLVTLLVGLAYCLLLVPDLPAKGIFLARSLGIAGILGALVLRYLYVQQQWRLRVDAENRARLQALQARIRPHFLFNCLNTISDLVHSAPDLAEQLIGSLAGLFRASLRQGEESTWGEELQLCRDYLAMEAQRLGPRLRVEWQVADLPARATLPSLLLQPLLENAIYHGIEPAHDPGSIRIRGRHHGELLELTIDNPPAARPARQGLHSALDTCARAWLPATASAVACRPAMTMPDVSACACGGPIYRCSRQRRMHVLIVDDEPPARHRLRRLLTSLDAGAELAEAADGIEAVEYCARHRTDVVLLDIRMPRMDGLEAALHLGTLETPPAVIFTTAYERHALAAFDVSAVAYLLKPVGAERLQQALQRAHALQRGQLGLLREQDGAAPRTYLSSTQAGSLRLAPVAEIRCFKADSKYVTALWPGGELLLVDTLKALEREFAADFLRVHRNALVAVRYLRGLQAPPGELPRLQLDGLAVPVPVSRRLLPTVRHRLRRL